MNILAFISAFAIVTIGALASSIEPEERQLPVGPGTFNITSIGVSGTGCPFGTVSYALNNQRTAVTLTFSNYYATAGPGIPISENRKNCQITLKVHVPHCYRFAIPTIDYYGYYQLDDKVKANLRASYYFAGQVQQAVANNTIVGPLSGDVRSYRLPFDVWSQVRSPCCGLDFVFNLNTGLRIDNSENKDGSGYIDNFDPDGQFQATLNSPKLLTRALSRP
ncbi:hypothetical protein FRC20_004021 [Serendipita sp. 405]|nr:hypothetical protein FRC15_004010 [Serendipita sp. 397]KAG8843253.1 hypothetical protein FRC20_004021 [Serendipita sp. 405]